MAKIAGQGGVAMENLLRTWSQAKTEGNWPADVQDKLDSFVLRLKAHHTEPPILYYCEWIDRWSMGDEFYGPLRVCGDRFEVTIFSPEEALKRSKQIRSKSPEQEWMAARLRECGAAFAELVGFATILLIRETLGPSATDDEYRLSEMEVPDWIEPDDGTLSVR